MMDEVINLKESIQDLRYNPSAIQTKTLDLLDSDIDVVDPSNPFVFLLEASSVHASATMMHCETLTRQQYPSMATTEEELYLHMSDRDYIGRFSTPSRTVFTLLFEKEELKKKALSSDIDGMNKIVIPKNTEFRIGDYHFTMQYPIEMRVMDYGSIQVVYDNSTLSPIETLSDNIVDWDVVKVENNEYVRIMVPVNQFKINSYYNAISKTTPFNINLNFEKQFYYARVYYQNGDGNWKEIKTTHTDQVFDPYEPTAVLKVYKNTLGITIPQVYIDSDLIDGTVRVDIYETLGKLELMLSNYQINEFIVSWIDRDLKDGVGEYTVPLTTFSSMAVYSDSVVTGGGNSIDFEELRERVMTNALGNSQLPITQAQLNARMGNKGYESILEIDNITDRTYLATRRLPVPIATNTVSAASCTTTTLQVNYDLLESREGSIVNGERATITPNVLFNMVDGVLEIVSNEEKSSLPSLSVEDYLNQVNSNKYLFTPFHYVLDGTGDYFDVRPYYLDNPKATFKEFVEENTQSNLYISTDSFGITKQGNRYIIQVTTKSGDAIKEMEDYRVMPVLSFKPDDQRSEVYLEGELLFINDDDERVYNFYLDTDLDIDSQHYLLLNNFKMFSNDSEDYKVSLNATFDLVYYIKGLDRNLPTLNYRPNCYLIDLFDYGITHEKLSFKLGTFLEGLWERSRTIMGESNYLTYEEDVYSFYEENIYERDDNGNLVFTRDSEGKLSYNLLHSKGDPILDEDGNQLIKHSAGDLVLDHNDKPIIKNYGLITRDFDMFLIDGKYKFSNFSDDINYLNELPETIIGWLENDIKDFSELMLEQTILYFHPQRTFGNSKFLILDSEEHSLNLEQAFNVTFYLENDKFNDSYLRESLRQISIDTINEELKKDKIKINNITSKLTASVGDDVVALDINGLGGDLNLITASVINKTDRCSIRKKLIQDLDGTFKIVDDVDVSFIRHQS